MVAAMEFLSWWIRQIRGLVPRSIRRRANGRPDACVVSVEPRLPVAIQLSTRRAGTESALGRFVLDGPGIAGARSVLRKRDPVVVSVPEAMLLDRTIVVPFAAEADLANLLRYEMETITPFSAEEVFWTWSVVRRDRDRRRLYVRLSFVPKVALPSLGAALDGLGVTASWLEAATSDGPPRIIPFGQMAASAQRHRWGLRLVLAGTAALAVAVVVVPFVRQSLALGHIEDRIQALGPDMRLAQGLRERMTRTSSAAALVAAEHGRVADPLGVLAAVTTALPDDTFLTDLSIRQGKLEMTGESKAAAKLIAVLAATPAIKDPAFIASVTRAENGSDAFSIHADVAH